MPKDANKYSTMMRCALGVLALGLGGMLGCILYVDESTSECYAVTCGANAYCDQGLCSCHPGYGGVADVGCEPLMSVLVTDLCDDGLDVEFRLFSQDYATTWPTNSTLFTAGYNVDTIHEIRCASGEIVCFGAQAGELSWGVGLDGELGCGAPFRFECGPYTVDAGFLTCG